MRMWLILLVSPALLLAQKPVITDVVNGATFAPAGQPGHAIAPGSVFTIFGSNLASGTASASSTPLPLSLAGASVTVAGYPAPLFYVSPTQINAQAPSVLNAYGFAGWPLANLKVSGPGGFSDPVTVTANDQVPGIFTLDASGCGRGVVQNVTLGGAVSLNSPQNSAVPGSYLTIFATGLGTPKGLLPDGQPAPLTPPLRDTSGVDVMVGHTGTAGLLPPTQPSGLLIPFVGKAPGMVGVDQINIQLPDDVIEGCGVPLQLFACCLRDFSQPVPVSIRGGGGPCVDPPPDSVSVLNLVKTAASGISPAPPSDQLQADFASALSKQPPQSMSLTQQYAAERNLRVTFEPTGLSGESLLSVLQPGQCRCEGLSSAVPLAPACPGFTQYDDSALNAGVISITGKGGVPVQVSASSAKDGSYLAPLPEGTIQAGPFQVSGLGGADVGPFTASMQVPSGIQIRTNLSPGTTFTVPGKNFDLPFPILGVSWTGGDPAAIVRILVSSVADTPTGAYADVCECAALASAGGIGVSSTTPRILEGNNVEVLIEVRSEGPQQQRFGAQGLTLGGYLGWIYRYRFGGLIVKTAN